MTDQHPITPPPELVEQWLNNAFKTRLSDGLKIEKIAAQAARWGADTELEACCEWVQTFADWGDLLRSDRRPKSQTLKEQALEAFEKCWNDGYLKANQADVIRRALEAVPDD